MNKKLRVALILSVALVAALGMVMVSAQGGDSLTNSTSWTLQNLASTTANVQVQFYSATGTGVPVASDTFTVSKSRAFYAPTYPVVPANFNGGLIASSDQPLASIANQLLVNNTTGRTAYATYMGATSSSVATTMYVPIVMRKYGGLYDTEISVQNTDTSDNNITIYYYDALGNEVVAARKTDTIKAGQPKRYPQSSATGLSDGFIGAAKVVAGSPVAVILNEFVGTPGNMYNQFYSFEGFASGSKTLYMPTVFINGYGGFNASASVQNLGGAPAHVTWYFYDSGVTTGAVYSFTETIAVAKSVYFPFASYANTLINASAVDAGWVGSIKIVSDQNLVGTVNELNGNYIAGSYRAFGSGATDLYYPTAFVKAYGIDANTSYAIADVSGTPGAVNVTVSYIADKEACPTCNDANVTYNFTTADSQYQPTHMAATAPSALGTGGVFVGSIKIHVNTAGKTINGTMNELINTVNGDGFTAFDAFTNP